MGCATSASQPTERLAKEQEQMRDWTTVVKHDKVEAISQLRFGKNNLVLQNKNRILREYSILSPPIGKGSFGEVRKAIHKSTGLNRAVKIINNKASTSEELERITREVKILNKLVVPAQPGPPAYHQSPRVLPRRPSPLHRH